MGSSAPSARFLQARITYLSTNLIKRLENIFAAALQNPSPTNNTSTSTNATSAAAAIDPSSSTTNPARNGVPGSTTGAFTNTNTAIEQFQLDVESTALVRAAEELLVLTRSMKDLWLFGGLDTLEGQEGDNSGVGGAGTRTTADEKMAGVVENVDVEGGGRDDVKKRSDSKKDWMMPVEEDVRVVMEYLQRNVVGAAVRESGG